MALAIEDNWGNKNRFFSVRNITKNINDPDPTEADRRRFVITPWDLDTSLGGRYDGAYYDGNYTVWPMVNFFNNAPYPFFPVIGDADYLKILKQRWIEGRNGAFSVQSVFNKLEKYRDLFIQSGAWQRMMEHFGAQNSSPKLVLDLTREIFLIEQWYVNRFLEMDDFFGIPRTQEVIDNVNVNVNVNGNERTIYNSVGQRICKLQKGINIVNGKKVLY